LTVTVSQASLKDHLKKQYPKYDLKACYEAIKAISIDAVDGN